MGLGLLDLVSAFWGVAVPDGAGCEIQGVPKLVSRDFLRLLPVCWWVELSPRVSSCRVVKFPMLVWAHWWMALVTDRADYRVWGIPKLILIRW